MYLTAVSWTIAATAMIWPTSLLLAIFCNTALLLLESSTETTSTKSLFVPPVTAIFTVVFPISFAASSRDSFPCATFISFLTDSAANGIVDATNVSFAPEANSFPAFFSVRAVNLLLNATSACTFSLSICALPFNDNSLSLSRIIFKSLFSPLDALSFFESKR